MTKIHEFESRKFPIWEIDNRFLVPGFHEFVAEAHHRLMNEYNNQLWELMVHYGVMDEAELLSGCARRFSRKVCPNSRGLNDVQIKLNKKVKYLMKHYRDIFWESCLNDTCGNDGDSSNFVSQKADTPFNQSDTSTVDANVHTNVMIDH